MVYAIHAPTRFESPSASTNDPVPILNGMTTLPLAGWLVLPLLILQNGRPEHDWLSANEIDRERLGAVLAEVSGMKPDTAAVRAEQFKQQAATLTGEGKWAATLLEAVAWQAAGSPTFAKGTFELLIAQAKDTPYARTAEVELARLEHDSPRTAEHYFKRLAAEPGADEKRAWYRIDGNWIWTSKREASLRFLAASRSSFVSLRLYGALRSISPFAPRYHYVFILLCMTLLIKVILSPVLWRMAVVQMRMRRLAPEIRSLHEIYSSDLLLLHQHLQAFYTRHGLNYRGGCWLVVGELFLAIWMLALLGQCSPLVALDGSRFLWIADVTRFDFGAAVLMIAVSALPQYMMAKMTHSRVLPAQIGCGLLSSGFFLLAVSWIWAWPAYVFLFGILLMGTGLGITFLLSRLAAVIQREPR